MSVAPGAVLLDGESLTVEKLAAVARDPRRRVELCPEAMARVRAGREQIDAIVRRYEADYRRYRRGESARRPVQDYGVTTGFGEFKDIPVPPEELEQLQHNLLLGHSVGVGESSDPDDPANYFPPEVVRATLVIRINAFLKGCSGVRAELVEAVRDLLHAGVVPRVPVRGSMGSSGDLCPLAHLFSVFLGAGSYTLVRRPEEMGHRPRELLSAARDLEADLGGPVLSPSYKEGLALSNGATFSTALLALAVHDAAAAARVADAAAALSLEAACGCARALDPKVHAARGHAGQIESAASLRRLLAGSRLLERTGAVQDPYSLRCAPVVHGASREAIDYARAVAEREMNAATDNPLFFDDTEAWDYRFADNWPEGYDGRERASYSAGNFHGQPIALAADFLAIAAAELANVSERRTQLLLDRHHNRNLPANLVARRGLNSGYMLAQYSAASLVTENKVLAHPASVDSIPTAANSEDHVAVATTAARKARTVVANVQAALAIELMVAAQAVDWRAGMGYKPVSLRSGEPPEAADGARSPVGAVEGWNPAQEEAEAFERAVAPERRAAIAEQLGTGTRAAYLAVRERVEALKADRPLAEDIRRLRELVESGELLGRIEAALGGG